VTANNQQRPWELPGNSLGAHADQTRFQTPSFVEADGYEIELLGLPKDNIDRRAILNHAKCNGQRLRWIVEDVIDLFFRADWLSILRRIDHMEYRDLRAHVSRHSPRQLKRQTIVSASDKRHKDAFGVAKLRSTRMATSASQSFSTPWTVRQGSSC